jgi:fatty acid desaturase
MDSSLILLKYTDEKAYSYWRSFLNPPRSINQLRSIAYVFLVLFLTFAAFLYLSDIVNKDNVSLQNFLFLYLIIGYIYYQYQFILHEAAHGVLFSSRKVNDTIGSFVGIISGYDFRSYRIGHMKHHKFLGSADDPEYVNFTRNKILVLLKSFLMIDCFYLFTNLANLKNKKIKGLKTFNFSVLLSIIFYTALTFFFNNSLQHAIFFLLIFLVAVGSFTFTINRIRSVLEHPEISGKVVTRSYPKKSFFSLFLAPFNFNFHLEHHIFPEISSSHYPKVHKQLENLSVYYENN